MSEEDGGALVRRADIHEYRSEPMPEAVRKNGPQVTLLNATPDPLGSLAALIGIYKGKVFRSLSEVTHSDRRAALESMQKTVLNGPLEAVTFQFLIEGVGRDFTHQAVRGRHAFYAQESLRFAVKENWAQEVPLPPSLSSTRGGEALGAESSEAEYARNLWDESMANAAGTYAHLIGAGVPAEDARKVLPHAVTTRYMWICSLRELLYVAGVRTCTQAQFEWRQVMSRIAVEIRDWNREQCGSCLGVTGYPCICNDGDNWQFQEIAAALRPICYQTGKCGFKAEFDRSCTIRSRVDMNERAGRPSLEWDQDAIVPVPDGREEGSTTLMYLKAIKPSEWAASPGAARA